MSKRSAPTSLYRLTATGPRGTIALHFTDSDVLDAAAFTLRQEGFEVEGDREWPTKIMQSVDEALESARAFCK